MRKMNPCLCESFPGLREIWPDFQDLRQNMAWGTIEHNPEHNLLHRDTRKSLIRQDDRKWEQPRKLKELHQIMTALEGRKHNPGRKTVFIQDPPMLSTYLGGQTSKQIIYTF